MAKAIREAYGEALVKYGSEDSRVVVLDADVSSSTKSGMFRTVCPGRFFNCGISESAMMGMAAGLAQSGKIPFVKHVRRVPEHYRRGGRQDVLILFRAERQADGRIRGAFRRLRRAHPSRPGGYFYDAHPAGHDGAGSLRRTDHGLDGKGMHRTGGPDVRAAFPGSGPRVPSGRR